MSNPMIRFTPALLACALATAAPARARDDALLEAASAERPSLTATLGQLVAFESGSRDGASLARFATHLETRLQALDMTVQRVGGNLLATRRGKGGKHVLLMAHMDTVYPAGTLAQSPFRVEGNKAYGPGIADDKSGIAVILHALAFLQRRGWADAGTVTVLFNNDEETGSGASHALIEQAAARADYVLSFEPNLAGQEGFTLGTSGVATVQAVVKGKAAHAGMAPDAGVNALVEAADLVARTSALDDAAAGLRFNWTTMQAGGAGNAIPASATLGADVRFASNEQIPVLARALEQKAQQKKLPASEVTVTLVPSHPAFNADAGSRTLMQKAVGIYAEAGGKVQIVPRIGGGTDAAYAALSGRPVLEGLGLPGAGMHGSAAEYVDLDAVPRRLYLAVRLIAELSR